MHSTQSLWAASTGISSFIEDKTGRTDKSQCFYTLTEMVFEVLVAVFQITFLLSGSKYFYLPRFMQTVQYLYL